MSLKPQGRVVYANARLLDPATGLDVIGGVLTDGEKIADFGVEFASPSGA